MEIKKSFDQGWISSKSPWVEKFESLFARKISGTKYAVSVNSGTSALFLALKGLGIGPGDEVILPSLTMIATVNAVSWTGATPVLVDSVSHDDWNMDPDAIEGKITKKTKAILPVHLYGYPCDMDKIAAVARKHKIFVVEDAAEAMGTMYKKRLIGSYGDISCFSLYANKIVTTGNGGMVCMNDKKTYQLIKKLEFFDFNETTHFKHNLIGYNLVLSGLQAALGYSQMKRFERLIKKRRQVFDWYRKNLGNNEVFRFVDSDSKNSPNYWFPAIIFKDSAQKRKVITRLEKNNIETREFFLPVDSQPVYKDKFREQFYPNAKYFYERGLLLPSFFDLTHPEVEKICSVIVNS